jgi:mono/diheme cytochrome c family protein
MRHTGWIVFALVLSAMTAQAQDPQEGAKWATNVCGECHAIAREQLRSPNGRAPTFIELANTPGMTTAAHDASRRNADVCPDVRTAAGHHCLHSWPEG